MIWNLFLIPYYLAFCYIFSNLFHLFVLSLLGIFFWVRIGAKTRASYFCPVRTSV